MDVPSSRGERRLTSTGLEHETGEEAAKHLQWLHDTYCKGKTAPKLHLTPICYRNAIDMGRHSGWLNSVAFSMLSAFTRQPMDPMGTTALFITPARDPQVVWKWHAWGIYLGHTKSKGRALFIFDIERDAYENETEKLAARRNTLNSRQKQLISVLKISKSVYVHADCKHLRGPNRCYPETVKWIESILAWGDGYLPDEVLQDPRLQSFIKLERP